MHEQIEEKPLPKARTSFAAKYGVLQKELYNFESVYETIQRTCTVF
jgi:hypothetical protein